MRAPEFWHGSRGPLAGLAGGLLTPLGTAWGTAGRLRRAVARPYRAAVPVVCVGNLVAGGAGKTPVVLALVRMLSETGTPVHLVTRGYGGRRAGPLRVDPAAHDAAAVGDEALLLAQRAPTWVARDRAAGVREAAAAGAAIVLLDDGFQNPGIAKNLSLLAIDAEYGFGNCRVMPAGPLREPVAAGLARADAVALIGDGPLPSDVAAAALPVLRASLVAIDGERFAGARIVAFAGIGRPEKFFATLRRRGAALSEVRPFPDHHRYSEADIARLRREAAQADARLVTTAKDWVRLPVAARAGIEVLNIEVVWQNPNAVERLLADVLERVPHDGDGRAAGD